MPARCIIRRLGSNTLDEPIVGTVDRDFEFSFENYALEYDVAFAAMGGDETPVLAAVKHFRQLRNVSRLCTLKMQERQVVACLVLARVAALLRDAVEYGDIREHARTIEKVARRVARFWIRNEYPGGIQKLMRKTAPQLSSIANTAKEAMPYRYVYYVECLDGLRRLAYISVTYTGELTSYSKKQQIWSIVAHVEKMISHNIPEAFMQLRIAESTLTAYKEWLGDTRDKVIGFNKALGKFADVKWPQMSTPQLYNEMYREIGSMMIDVVEEMQNDGLLGPLELI